MRGPWWDQRHHHGPVGRSRSRCCSHAGQSTGCLTGWKVTHGQYISLNKTRSAARARGMCFTGIRSNAALLNGSWPCCCILTGSGSPFPALLWGRSWHAALATIGTRSHCACIMSRIWCFITILLIPPLLFWLSCSTPTSMYYVRMDVCRICASVANMLDYVRSCVGSFVNHAAGGSGHKSVGGAD